MGAFFIERNDFMARKVAIRPVEPLELEFSDGTVKKAWFTNASMIKLTTMYDDINILMEDGKKNPYDFCSKVLHCALSIENPNMSLEECMVILIQGGEELLLEIYGAIVDNFGLESNDEAKKKMEHILQNL